MSISYAFSHFVPVTATITIVIMRILDPQRYGEGETLLEQGRTCFLLLLLTLLHFCIRKMYLGSHFSIYQACSEFIWPHQRLACHHQ